MNFLRVWSVFVTISLTLSCGSSMPGSSNPPAGGNSSIVISSTSPTSIAAGSPDFTITVIGTGFPSEPFGFQGSSCSVLAAEQQSSGWDVSERRQPSLRCNACDGNGSLVLSRECGHRQIASADLLFCGRYSEIGVQLDHLRSDELRAINDVTRLG